MTHIVTVSHCFHSYCLPGKEVVMEMERQLSIAARSRRQKATRTNSGVKNIERTMVIVGTTRY